MWACFTVYVCVYIMLRGSDAAEAWLPVCPISVGDEVLAVSAFKITCWGFLAHNEFQNDHNRLKSAPFL